MNVFQDYTPGVGWEDLLGRPVESIRNQEFPSVLPWEGSTSQVPGNVGGMSSPQSQPLMLPETAVLEIAASLEIIKMQGGACWIPEDGVSYISGGRLLLLGGACAS